MIELWKDCLGLNGEYQASNLGNVRSLNRFVYGCVESTNGYPKKRPGVLLKGRVKSHGYRSVKIKKKDKYVHRLVWEAHFGLIPDGLDVNHKNGIRSDNRIENLELLTRKENVIHGINRRKRLEEESSSHP